MEKLEKAIKQITGGCYFVVYASGTFKKLTCRIENMRNAGYLNNPAIILNCYGLPQRVEDMAKYHECKFSKCWKAAKKATAKGFIRKLETTDFTKIEEYLEVSAENYY